MRDMSCRKFERCMRFNGFSPVPNKHREFVADDGLTVPAVMRRHPVNNATELAIDRRASLRAAAAARANVDLYQSTKAASPQRRTA